VSRSFEENAVKSPESLPQSDVQSVHHQAVFPPVMNHVCYLAAKADKKPIAASVQAVSEPISCNSCRHERADEEAERWDGMA
jgi:hypothetical protein